MRPIDRLNLLDLLNRGLRARLDFLSSRIPDPVNKLWFINRTLEGYEAKPESLRRLPIVRSIVFHYVALESIGELAGSTGQGEIFLPKSPLRIAYRLRHALLLITVLAIGYTGYAAGNYGYGLGRQGADWLFSQLIPVPAVASNIPPTSFAARASPPPQNVWLVEEDDDGELWSNGLRVVTTFETPGSPRSYFAFPRDGSPPILKGGAPVGIVYHASQNDMAPLAREFNHSILSTTQDLLGWLSRREIYNYMIDRFGQVYRIVSDAGVAVHAGASIWADADYQYLNLNESFIGVAFESRWDAGREVITPAQVQAALNLTDVLRSRHNIADQNCVPHGLVSVNPTKKLIGYHADLARGFPFGALGLEDKYLLPPASMTAFGFTFDEDLVERLGGELWPGVARAERELNTRAQRDGITSDVLRARLNLRYQQNIDLVTASKSEGADRTRARR